MKLPSAHVQETCAQLLRSTDWAKSPLGPYAQWPERLKGYVAMVLAMPTPAVLFWGPTQIQIYNDGYGVIMGPRHPKYFGAAYQDCWPETYSVIHPWMERVLQGEVRHVEHELVVLTRHGFTEEAYFTFTFSPLLDDSDDIAGILQPVVEVTNEVIAARRMEVLRALEEASLEGGDVRDAAKALCSHPKDVPFGVFFIPGPDGKLVLETHCGLSPEQSVALRDPTATVETVFSSGEAVVVEASTVLLGEQHTSEWGDPVRQAYVLPVLRGSAEVPRGVLVCGISPRLQLDEAYRNFLSSIARDTAAILDAARARAGELVLHQQAVLARAQAEAERNRLHTVFHNAPVAITMLTGTRHVIDLANPRVCDLWGRPVEELLGKAMFDAVPEAAGQGLEQLLDGVRTTGVAYIGTELRVSLRSPVDQQLHDHFFNFVYEPMKTPDGVVEAILVVAADVTVSVLARQAAERLAGELQSARRDAEHARDLAQQASSAKDDFLAMLGHELRNPLAPIFTALDLWRDRDPSGASAASREVIERQARHLKVLVDDLLDMSRIATGKVELKKSVVCVSDLITKAIETASPLLESRRHQVDVESVPAVFVDGDPARLVQVFANLLTNAAKYTEPSGHIRISIGADGGEVERTRAYTTVQPSDAAGGGERQPDRVVGHRLRAVVGHVAHRDAAGRRGCDVDRVHTDAVATDRAQTR